MVVTVDYVMLGSHASAALLKQQTFHAGLSRLLNPAPLTDVLLTSVIKFQKRAAANLKIQNENRNVKITDGVLIRPRHSKQEVPLIN